MEGLKKRANGIRVKVLTFLSILGMLMFIILTQANVVNVETKENMKNAETTENMKSVETKQKVSVTQVQEQSQPPVPMPKEIPAGRVYPRPIGLPFLRKYEINKDTGVEIWHARDPASYITKNNEWVKYVASELYVDDHGRIMYKNKPIIRAMDYKGNVTAWTDEPFLNSYVSDDELFNFPANADIWQNADYYLSHGMRGECKDWTIAVTSMMLSGEMSIKENGTYVRQVIPAKAVIGYSGKSKDVWVEYNIHGTRYISGTGTEFHHDTGKYESMTTFHVESDWGTQFEPIYQFTDKSFGKYVNEKKYENNT